MVKEVRDLMSLVQSLAAYKADRADLLARANRGEDVCRELHTNSCMRAIKSRALKIKIQLIADMVSDEFSLDEIA